MEFEECPFSLDVTADEWEMIKRGAMPRSMNENWVIFFRDGWLNFHRVGHTLFRLEASDEGAQAFDVLHCRRGIEPYYRPRKPEDEAAMIRELLGVRLSRSADEPWFGWDDKHPGGEDQVAPDLAEFATR
ncbi:MAG: hypothetical protein AAGF13_01885 [Pseudomonadota bacterium]